MVFLALKTARGNPKPSDLRRARALAAAFPSFVAADVTAWIGREGKRPTEVPGNGAVVENVHEGAPAAFVP